MSDAARKPGPLLLLKQLMSRLRVGRRPRRRAGSGLIILSDKIQGDCADQARDVSIKRALK